MAGMFIQVKKQLRVYLDNMIQQPVAVQSQYYTLQ